MSEKMHILQMIENGEISPEEGIRLINKLEEAARTEPDSTPETMEILTKIEEGSISAEDGIGLIQNNAQAEIESDVEVEFAESPPPEASILQTKEIQRWKRWWSYLMYVGMGVAVLSTLWMSSSYQNHGYNFWFFCSWLPLLIGIFIVTLALRSQNGPWIHIRVKSPTDNVAISIPAPIGLTSWGLRNFGHYIPKYQPEFTDDIINALENTAKNNTPFYIHVDDEEDSEKVEIFIG